MNQINLSNGYEDLEQKTLDYLANKSSNHEGEILTFSSMKNDDNEEGNSEETNDTEDALKNVKFSMDWVKQAHKKLKS